MDKKEIIETMIEFREKGAEFYDTVEEEYNNCTVRLIENSLTEEISVGWLHNNLREQKDIIIKVLRRYKDLDETQIMCIVNQIVKELGWE